MGKGLAETNWLRVSASRPYAIALLSAGAASFINNVKEPVRDLSICSLFVLFQDAKSIPEQKIFSSRSVA